MINFVQGTAVTNGAPSLRNVGAGDTLIGVVLWATAPGTAPADSQNQTWLPAIQPWSGQNFAQTISPYLQIFYKLNTNAATNLQILFPSRYAVMASAVLEYSGITKFVTAVGNAGFGGTSPFVTPNINTNMGDQLVAVGTCNGQNLLPTPGSGFVQRVAGVLPNLSIADAMAIGGLYRASFSADNVDTYTTLMASFR
jgi:hypothetical protein